MAHRSDGIKNLSKIGIVHMHDGRVGNFLITAKSRYFWYFLQMVVFLAAEGGEGLVFRVVVKRVLMML